MAEEIDLFAAAMTIDPIQSRILQSASLQKENAAMAEEDDPAQQQQQQPVFPKLSAAQASGNKIEYRRVRCPPHRYTPLRENWEQILTPLVEYLKLQVRILQRRRTVSECMQRKKRPVLRNVHCVVPRNEQTLQEASMQYGTKWGGHDDRSLMHACSVYMKLYPLEHRSVCVRSKRYSALLMSFFHSCLFVQVRFNTKTRSVEMKTSPHTVDVGALQKGADFVSAFMMGFEVQDAVALLRLDDLYVESFQVTDVKLLRGDHLSRAIGRVAGQDGKTRFAIENATRTRIVIADQRIHMLGSYANLRVARNAICDLILGAPPGKVYNNMRNVAKRMSERY